MEEFEGSDPAYSGTVQQIILFPNDVLTQSSGLVEGDREFNSYLRDLVPTMLTYGGVGLAAIQVGWADRAIAVLSGPKSETVTLAINPKVTDYGDEMDYRKEGCLSVPGIEVPVKRYTEITVEYEDLAGEKVTVAVEGFEARVFQHEIDHLDGILHLDHVSDFRRRELVQKYTKQMNKVYRKIRKGLI